MRGYFRTLTARLDGVEDYEERIVVAMTSAAFICLLLLESIEYFAD